MLSRNAQERRLRNAQERLGALRQAIVTHERRLETSRAKLAVAEQEVAWLEQAPVLDEPAEPAEPGYSEEEDSEGPVWG